MAQRPSSNALRRNRRPGRAPVLPPREPPRTARGERTRAALVAAARVVFERDGYINARLTDITDEASMASGTFYTYFTGKEDIFAAVLEQVQEEMLHPHVRQATEEEDPVATIRASNRAYLEGYERNAKLMQLLEEVSIYDDKVKELRRRRTTAFGQRNANAIRELQLRGVADPSIDPLIAAHALSHMVARMAHARFVLGEPWDIDDLVDTLTRLWANALRIEQPVGAKTPRARKKAK